MKILFYSPVKLSNGGGCERWHCDITKSLNAQFDYDIEIATAGIGEEKWDSRYLKSQLKNIPYTLLHFSPRSALTLYQKAKSADCIHFIHGFAGQDILMVIIKFLTGRKILVGHHAPIFHKSGLHNFYMRLVSRYLLKQFDAHMTLNAKDKAFLEKNWGITHVQFIPSGIQIERFLVLPKKRHAQLNFLTVGIYRNQKGIDLLLEAIEMFNKRIPNNQAKFKFVGSGELESLVNNTAKKHSNVFNLHYIKYEDMPRVYEESDVYVLPSREEPFGLVLIEAWASGIPVLATKTDGPNDMLVEGKNGWFINEITSTSIYQGLLKTYSDWQKNKNILFAMEKDCRTTGEKYGIDTTASKMANIFRQFTNASTKPA